MALVLNIDSSGKEGVVALARNGISICERLNSDPMQHASFLQPAIRDIFHETGISFNQVDAVAVSNGPGSYTGLRVGLAAAKGLCYALSKPLITVSSLEVMAFSVCQNMATDLVDEKTLCSSNHDAHVAQTPDDIRNLSSVLYCPMIDARRMEVFFALYGDAMQKMIQPAAAILDSHFLGGYRKDHIIKYFGSGALKWRDTLPGYNFVFVPEPATGAALCHLSHKKYIVSDFDMLSTAIPFYVKDFYSVSPAPSKLS